MSPVLLFTVQMVLGIVVPFWIVRRDLARLPDDRLDHAWTEATFWMAIVVFGPLCLPFHFVKTRKNRGIGLGLGLFWFVSATAFMELVDWCLSALSS